MKQVKGPGKFDVVCFPLCLLAALDKQKTATYMYDSQQAFSNAAASRDKHAN